MPDMYRISELVTGQDLYEMCEQTCMSEVFCCFFVLLYVLFVSFVHLAAGENFHSASEHMRV